MNVGSRRSRLWLRWFAVLAVVVTLAATEAGGVPGAGAAPRAQGNGQGVPPDDAARGLHYGDLRGGDPNGPCKGAFEMPLVSGPAACTHGPDPAPDGVDVRYEVAIPAQTTEPSVALAATPCSGDGVSGNRVQLVYAHAAGVTDRYASLLSSFATWAAQMNDVFVASAAETGGTRNVRFVHDAACNPTVVDLSMTATGDDSFTNTINELRNQGYSAPNRKYVVWVDANV
jgi:hypothetical protein